jgi:hypothetical protein
MSFVINHTQSSNYFTVYDLWKWVSLNKKKRPLSVRVISQTRSLCHRISKHRYTQLQLQFKNFVLSSLFCRARRMGRDRWQGIPLPLRYTRTESVRCWSFDTIILTSLHAKFLAGRQRVLYFSCRPQRQTGESKCRQPEEAPRAGVSSRSQGKGVYISRGSSGPPSQSWVSLPKRGLLIFPKYDYILSTQNYG